MRPPSLNDRNNTGVDACRSCFLVGRGARSALVCLLLLASVAAGNAAEVTEGMWRDVMQANAELRALVTAQHEELVALRARVEQLETAVAETRPFSTAPTRDPVFDRDVPLPEPSQVQRSTSDRLILSGEAGAAFFAGGADSEFPNEEFRIDEATLRLEAEAARGIYLFGELQLTTREAIDESFHLGEFYLEFEDLGDGNRLFNLRLGRVDVPFGEEYAMRDVTKNPLITHTVADIWGTDEGIALFGQAGRADYAVAVTNGGTSRLHDFNADKSYAARLGFAATPSVRLSASAMRTGDLDALDDSFSEIWLGNVLFRPIGSDQTTVFHGELAEVDGIWSWQDGHLRAAYGVGRYDDNDPLADNRRRFSFYHVEALQHWTDRVFLAARYSAMRVRDGYPLAGLGDIGTYFFGPWSTRIWRLSLGGGYRFNPAVLLKLEYAFEGGELRNGNDRGDTDLFAAEAVLGF